MNEQTLELHDSAIEHEDEFHLISQVHKNPEITQRQLSALMNISLGKTNYLLNSLLQKGMVKIRNFSRNGGKLRKVGYMLTPAGFQAKARLTYFFLKKKEVEYNRLKVEWAMLENKSEPGKNEEDSHDIT
jgi:EPS-associated MarR family transcriptional regulator